MAWVYKYTSPSKRIYVGSTVNLKSRLSRYSNLNCKSQRKLYASFLKYGYDKHKFEIITECDSSEVRQMELHWGLFYNVLDYKAGLNLQLPKNGEQYVATAKDKNFCRIRTPEQRARHSEMMKGRPSPMKGRKTGLIPWNKGIPLSNEIKQKLSDALKGRKVWNKGKRFSEESKRRMSESSKGGIAWNRKIVMCSQTGIFYYSAGEAAMYSGLKRTTMQSMLDGTNRNKTTLNYV